MLATARGLSQGATSVQVLIASTGEEVCGSVVSCTLRLRAKVGPVGAHPLFEGALLERRRAQFWTCKTYYTSIVRAKVFNK